MDLDFCFNGKLDKSLIGLFNEIAFDIRQEFVDLIADLSQGNENNIDWWVSSPASRNPFVSPLFHYCCCLVLLQKLVKDSRTIDNIITDSRAFYEIVQRYINDTKPYLQCRLHLKKIRFGATIKARVSSVRAMLRTMAAWALCRLLIESRHTKMKNGVVLIETFVMPGFIKKDRYYPGLLENLSEKEKRNVFFVPTFYGIGLSGIASAILELKRSKTNYLFKERFLKLTDIFFALRWWKRALKLGAKIPRAYFHGVDVSLLAKEELRSLKGPAASIIPLLNYRLPMRLAENGIEVRLAIDWFENQVIDKGWNAGFRKHLPETELIGYQGFLITPHYLCMYPSQLEQDHGLLPTKMCVPGSKLVESIKEFCKNLQIETAPAFRFQHLWKEREIYPDPECFTILLALPLMLNEVSDLLTTVKDTLEKQNRNIRLWVKAHPGTSEKKVKKMLVPWPDRFELVQGHFSEILEKSDVLVSTASSIAMETLAKGIPVIIVGSRHGLTHNPIPSSITDDIWRLCFTTDELLNAVKFYQDRTTEKIAEHVAVGRNIRKQYFEPVTPESVRKFLGCVD